MMAVTMVDVDRYELVHAFATDDGHDRDERTHLMTLTPQTYRALCSARVTHEWLIVQAFRYLLGTRGRQALADSYDLGELSATEPGFVEAMQARTQDVDPRRAGPR